MSLLMDALKRAEASKQQAGSPDAQAAAPAPATSNDLAGLSLEPFSNENGERTTPLPDLASHIEAVDADLAASAAAPASEPAAPASPKPAPPAPAFVTQDSAREAARTLFAAKAPPPAPDRTGLWLALGALAIGGLAIGVYFWWQISSLGRPTGTTPPPALEISRSAPAPAPIAIESIPVPRPSATVLERSPAAGEAGAEREDTGTALTRGRLESAELQANSGSAIQTQVQLTRTRPTANPLVLSGWQQLQNGNLESARRDYEQSLQREPKNVDALLGLAVIAQRRGSAVEAERYYQLAFESDPKDAAAQAAVIGLSAPSDPSTAESRLKIALAEQPESPSLNFALGNLYAREQRWSEAQQAYFNAVASEGSNPDYLFNLAVSLDQLRQPRLAAQYYQKALEASSQRPAAFDRERVARRIGQLTATP